MKEETNIKKAIRTLIIGVLGCASLILLICGACTAFWLIVSKIAAFILAFATARIFNYWYSNNMLLVEKNSL